LIGYRRLYFDVSSLEAELISEELIDFHILPNRDTFFEINYTYSLKVEFFNNTFGFFQNPSLWMKEPRSRTSEVLSKWSYHPQKLFQTLLPEVIDTTIIFNSYKPDFITVGIPGADYKFNRSIVMTQELMISSNENYIESSSINLYPNPTTEHVSWEENVPVYIAIVYNTDGTPVLHKQRQNLKSIDLSRQSAGIYYIQLITIHGKKLPPQKIIKM